MKIETSTSFWEREEDWQDSTHRLNIVLLIFFMANLCYGIIRGNTIIILINLPACAVLFLEWRSYLKWSKQKTKKRSK